MFAEVAGENPEGKGAFLPLTLNGVKHGNCIVKLS